MWSPNNYPLWKAITGLRFALELHCWYVRIAQCLHYTHVLIIAIMWENGCILSGKPIISVLFSSQGA